MDHVGMLVADELHFMQEDDRRGAVLEGLLSKVLCSGAPVQMVGMSATLSRMDDICGFLGARCFQAHDRATPLSEYLVCGLSVYDREGNARHILL